MFEDPALVFVRADERYVYPPTSRARPVGPGAPLATVGATPWAGVGHVGDEGRSANAESRFSMYAGAGASACARTSG